MRRSRTIRIEGFDELTRKLNDPSLARMAMEDVITEAAKLGEITAIKAIDGGTGIATRSIQKKVWTRRLSARVYTMIAKVRALCINKGRKPGDAPTIRALSIWLTNKRNDWDLTDEERSTVIQVQQSIRKSGSKGKKYIPAAREAIENEIPSILTRALRRIKEAYRR